MSRRPLHGVEIERQILFRCSHGATPVIHPVFLLPDCLAEQDVPYFPAAIPEHDSSNEILGRSPTPCRSYKIPIRTYKPDES